jgi:uncharacterized membrane protein
VPIALASAPAAAELQFCNSTTGLISIAVGYWSPNELDWVSEGWWNLAAQRCGTVVSGPLTQRYYYVYAIDVRAGVEWGDAYYLCTQTEAFQIAGPADCVDRGFRRTGFFQVDTGEERRLYIVYLTADAATPAGPEVQ